MNITGKTMIFKGEYGYSCTISNKNEEGNYDRMYIQVQLPKGIELENKTIIEIQKGFMTFYKTKEGLPKLKIVIMDFETENKVEEAEQLDSSELPF